MTKNGMCFTFVISVCCASGVRKNLRMTPVPNSLRCFKPYAGLAAAFGVLAATSSMLMADCNCDSEQ